MKRNTPAADVAASFRPVPAQTPGHFTDEVKAASVRMPIRRYLWVQALAARGERSINEMTNELVRVGIAAVLAEMDDDIRVDVEDAYQAFSDEAGIPREEG